MHISKKIWGRLGIILFWLLWPVWVVYFANSKRRSRVIVICNDQVLLVRGWLGAGKYSLPGGGLDKHETYQAGAVRELREETGIVVPESALVNVGKRRNNKYHFNYDARFYCVELSDMPEIKPRWGEIFDVVWMPVSSPDWSILDDEATYAIKRYKPMEQASLL